MTESTIPAPIGPVPAYPDLHTYINYMGVLNLLEGDGWKEESMSWKTGVYMAINLSGRKEATFSGPGAQEFLSRLSINNVYDWAIGSSKHLVMTDENGLISSHGLAVRDTEDSFRHLAASPWPTYYAAQYGTDGLDVRISHRQTFILQIAGPRAVEVVEKVLGQSIRDLRFLKTRTVTLGDAPVEFDLELSRIGMTNSLAYEIRGAYEDGPVVYDTVYRAGQEFGITRLGWRTYPVNHTEGGFPQMMFHFAAACAYTDENYMKSAFAPPALPDHTGSVDPADIRARLRSPQEVNWSWMAKFDHDFVGRAALEAEAAAPKRKTVILRWNAEDVLDVYASHLRPGEEYKYIEIPCAPPPPSGGHADRVTVDGKDVGISAAGVYSYYYREMLSQCTIDLDRAEIGTEVILHWGDFGHRIKEIRATVAAFPYLDLPSNRDYDLSSIPELHPA